MLGNREATVKSYLIPGQTWPSELSWLYNLTRNSKVHVEVGVFCGRSLFASTVGMRAGQVYAVDRPFPIVGNTGFPSHEWTSEVVTATLKAIRAVNPNVGITQLNCGSINASREVKVRHPDGIDSIFIDAGHEYEHCYGDIEAWLPLVRPGGIICGHDYSSMFPGVCDAVNELLPGFKIEPDTRIWYKQL